MVSRFTGPFLPPLILQENSRFPWDCITGIASSCRRSLTGISSPGLCRLRLPLSVMGALSNAPIIGVGMPVYNGERYLAKAIESVMSQTMTDFEVVISDNASTDRTEEICRHYVAADARV